MKNYEIVDLILPDTFDKEEAKQDLDIKYAEIYHNSRFSIADGWLENNASEYIKELDAIENSQPKYDKEFWEKLKELNDKTLNIIGWRLNTNDEYVGFECMGEIDYSPNFNFNEIDLINKQYRLLQEIYYSRLEEK